ncbi:MAG: DNA endonuclease SmrA [Pseudomonadota bacterium]
MAEETDEFLDAMSDVSPLKSESRVRVDRRAEDKASLGARRAAAVASEPRDDNILAHEGIEPMDPCYILELKRPGIQNGVFRKLKQGRYPFEARLDLHRMSVVRARKEIFDFIKECRRLGLRSVMVVHGKGERSPNAAAIGVLKGYVNHWLRQLELVQAFHSALPKDGGTGAVYILLAKSEAKKQENRERFLRGRAT